MISYEILSPRHLFRIIESVELLPFQNQHAFTLLGNLRLGKYNSSINRESEVFNCLLGRDPSRKEWRKSLLKLPQGGLELNKEIWPLISLVHKKKNINPTPKYQRYSVWSRHQQQLGTVGSQTRKKGPSQLSIFRRCKNA